MAHVGSSRLSRPCAIALGLGVLLAPPVYGRNIRSRSVTSKQIARASWYGSDFQGKRTASGRPFNPHRLTAAHRTLDLGSKVKVTELSSGRSVVVQITDRGPFLPGRDIDLSYAGAGDLGFVRRGVARVRGELRADDVTRV